MSHQLQTVCTKVLHDWTLQVQRCCAYVRAMGQESSSFGTAYDCQACGACCDYSALWPRFSLESDEEIALIPAGFIARDEGGMRCTGNRCIALDGAVGKSVACSIYAVRPLVCRACLPGDDACLLARQRHGMPV